MEQAHISHASMAMGSVSINNSPCEIFEGLESTLRDAFVSIAAVTAGHSGGVSAEHPSKTFCIPHDDATRTLLVTSHRYDIMPICPYQETSQQMIVPVVIAQSSLISLRILSLPLPRQRVLVETFVDKSSHFKGFVVFYQMKD
jgi:hypothetical protein